MKKITYLILSLATVSTLTSCSDDDKKTNQQDCECYYTLVEGGQPQEGWTEPSDSIDCSLDGVKVYFEDWGENDTYYRILHCNPSE